MFKCVCGREFDSVSAFGGHKSHCRISLGDKYDPSIDKRRATKTSKTLKEKYAKQTEDKRLQRVLEQHQCETCGKIMTEKFASGRFCCKSCSNSHSALTNNERRVKNIKIAANHNPPAPKSKFSIVENYWYDYIKLNYPNLNIKQQVSISCPYIHNNNHYYRLDLLINDTYNVEIDGYHPRSKVDDKVNRDDYLNSIGIRVLRVPYINYKRQKDKIDQLINDTINFILQSCTH